ncbi:MAG: hypothetical protein IPK82_10415 [Polyangiaceae bacterium]|nr:hypothetical protein [Polyangiaceae bacterium]
MFGQPPITLWLLLTIPLVWVGCTANQSDCERNPNLGCYTGSGATGGSNASSSGMGGTSGTGGTTTTLSTTTLTGLLGVPCSSSQECETGYCVDGVCCSSECSARCLACVQELTGVKNGICAPMLEGADEPACVESKCGVDGWCSCEDGKKNGDETDIDCGGSCAATCTTGMNCSANSDCANGLPCVNGVCCTSACTQECKACNRPGLEGVCQLKLGSEPGCSGPTTCGPLATCSLASGEPCVDSTECASGVCQSGVCSPCATSSQCSPPNAYACINGMCTPHNLQDGVICYNEDQCNSGSCVDGVCCNTPCDGLCMACHISYTGQPNGTCAPILIGYDPQGECNGPGAAGTCSGALAMIVDGKLQSSCGVN